MIHALTEKGRRLKMMPVVDECSREGMTIEVECSVTAEDVVSILASLFRRRGELAFTRSDIRPEYIANAIKVWMEAFRIKTFYIEPGSLWKNAYLGRRSSVAFQTRC